MKIMLLSPKSKNKLVEFSLLLAKQPSTLEPISAQTRLQIVQKEWLAGDGLDVIPELMHNSQKTLDASTGSSAFAPHEKIEDEVKSVKSSQLPEYNNHLPQEDLVKAAHKYFVQIGVLGNATKLKQDVHDNSTSNDYFSVIGHGTTHLFTSSLKSILKTKGDVIIATQPSYGLFLSSINNAQGVIEPFVLNENNKFKPNPKALKQLIAKINVDRKEKYFKLIQHKRVLLNSFFSQVNLSQSEKTKFLNLLNKLSTEVKDTKNHDFTEIDSAMELYHAALRTLVTQKIKNDDEVSMWYETLSLPLCQRVRAYFHMNPHMPMGTICEQKEINQLSDAIKHFSDVQVIDDLTYYDLVLPDAKSTPGTFANSSLAHRTLTLYSLSKQFALASVRAGIALGPKHLIKPICEDIFDSNNTPNIFTRDAFYSILNWSQQQRVEYLSETNQEYAHRRDLTLALVQGQKNLSKTSLSNIQKTLTKLNISLDEQKLLLAGIPGLKTLVTPESGYFVIIDFSHYQGKYLGTTQLNQSRDFRNAFYRLADVNTIPGEMMYMFDKPVLRFSYSMTPKEILDSLARIKSVLALCQPKPMTKKEIEAIKKDSSKKTTPFPKSARAAALAPPPEKEVSRVFLPKYQAQLEKKRLAKQCTSKKSSILLPDATLNRTKGRRKVKPSKLVIL